MSVTVHVTTRQLSAVERGIRAITAERDVLERNGMVSVELEADLVHLEGLRDVIRAEREQAIPVSRPASLAVVR